MADQFAQPLRKFEQALADYERRRSDMSLCTRVIVANVFLLSMFAFPCRHFYMPNDIITRVEGALLQFFARIPFARLGFFAHLTPFYGIRVQLHDLRLCNVAMLYHRTSRMPPRWRPFGITCNWALTSPTRFTPSAVGTKLAPSSAGPRVALQTLCWRPKPATDLSPTPLYRWWYDALLDTEAPAWRE